MRKLPNSVKNIKLENDISFIGFNLHLSGYFEESMMKVSTMTKKLKRSLYPVGALALTQFANYLPQILCQFIKKFGMSKGTLVLSNLPGPKIPYQFDGFKSKGIIAMLPGNGDLLFGLLAVSHHDSLYMTISADYSNI